ncbi:MAG: DUF4112 domain-containing protein [Planctomycetaceae bacterium]|nr:DUF4112 domain-containing protein [Planctomycetaceae bacterium]
MIDRSRTPESPPVTVFQEGEHVPRIGDLEQLARWMDSVFAIPGTPIRFGFDAIIGLLPGAGDTLLALVSLYILQAAARYGVPRVTLVRMALNVIIDLVIGSLPLLGDFFDVAWKANTRNVALLRAHAAATPGELRRVRRGDWLFVAAIGAVILAVLAGALLFTYWIVVAIGRALFGGA